MAHTFFGFFGSSVRIKCDSHNLPLSVSIKRHLFAFKRTMPVSDVVNFHMTGSWLLKPSTMHISTSRGDFLLFGFKEQDIDAVSGMLGYSVNHLRYHSLH